MNIDNKTHQPWSENPADRQYMEFCYRGHPRRTAFAQHYRYKKTQRNQDNPGIREKGVTGKT